MVVVVVLVVVEIEIVIVSEIIIGFKTSINNNYNNNNNSKVIVRIVLINSLPILLGPCSEGYRHWLNSRCHILASFGRVPDTFEAPKNKWASPVKKWNCFQKVLGDDLGVGHMGSHGLPEGYTRKHTWVIMNPLFRLRPLAVVKSLMKGRRKGGSVIALCLPSTRNYHFPHLLGYRTMKGKRLFSCYKWGNKGSGVCRKLAKVMQLVQEKPGLQSRSIYPIRDFPRLLPPSHLPLLKAWLGYWAPKLVFTCSLTNGH